jgi:hypothetical protein
MARLTEEQKALRALKRRRTEALKAEAQALRHEAKRREWDEQGMYLTREEARAGALCRGCGLPIVDNRGSWPPLMHLTGEERAEYDAAQAAYRVAHPDCGSYGWSISGSRARHCGLCCPPVPFSDETLEQVRRILESIPADRDRDRELDTWALLLTCEHRIERTQHYTHRHWSSGPTAHCPDCDLTRGIVSSERITTAATRARDAENRRKAAVDRARREVAKAEAQAKAARKKLDELEAGQPG